ncbi:MAG: threonine synthase [Corynebacterium sp.]|nr:threonine synthase [Corynebacterium sp.]
MRYISTRDTTATPRSFTDILLTGLAPDGGLYLPERYPEWIPEAWSCLTYPELAAEILKLYVDDIPAADLEAIAARAYTSPKFSAPEIVPLVELTDGLLLGKISEGPTAAFKDMAMQLLGELFEYELSRRGETLTILGATSGDTGSSAEYALRGRPGLSVFMLTPAGRMTPFQQAQMFGLTDANIHNIALDGAFDDCQDVVKAVNADAQFKADYHIGAVNSINWARLLAQTVYYIWLTLRARDLGHESVSFSVPTGNFGDICAGHIARQMGAPIDHLIVATNENDVLDEFFRTGTYRPRPSVVTSSPSMDISKASNFERFICDVLDRDAARTAELFTGSPQFDLSQVAPDRWPDVREKYGFVSAKSTHADRIATIRDMFARTETMLDPHTADGVFAAQHYGYPATICIETALPVKFSETIHEALDRAPITPERFAHIEDGPRRVAELPNDVQVVKDFIAKYTNH